MATLEARRLRLDLIYKDDQNCRVQLKLAKETSMKLTIKDFNVSITEINLYFQIIFN